MGVLGVLQAPTDISWLGQLLALQCNKWEFLVCYKHPLTSVGWGSWRCGCPQLSLSLHVQHAVKDLRGALCLAMTQCQQPAQHITQTVTAHQTSVTAHHTNISDSTQTSVTAHHTHISDSTPHTHISDSTSHTHQ